MFLLHDWFKGRWAISADDRREYSPERRAMLQQVYKRWADTMAVDKEFERLPRERDTLSI